MRINARLKKLEARVPKPVRCPTCGNRLDGGRDPYPKINVAFPRVRNPFAPPEPIDTSRDYCKTCGRQLVIRLRFPPVRKTTD